LSSHARLCRNQETCEPTLYGLVARLDAGEPETVAAVTEFFRAVHGVIKIAARELHALH
jgi:hypothetical protein